MLQKILVCLVLLLPASSFAAELKPMTINYTVSIDSDKLGNATLGRLATTLTKTDTGYEVYSQTKAQGFAVIMLGTNIEEKCKFSITDGRVVSDQYSGGKKKRTDYDVNFDWQNRKVIFDADNSLDMPQGYVVDNCNLPFVAALSEGKDLTKEILYVVDGKNERIRGYTLKSTTEEKLQTPIGQIDTIKVVLQRELRKKRTLTLWLAVDKQFAPIKMEEKRESRTTTMLVTQLDMS